MMQLSNQENLSLSEAQKKAKWIKTARWIYWILTIAFGATMFIAGVVYFIGVPAVVQNNAHLGYPLYFYKVLGVAKILGSIAILWGRFPTLKEWAYVGYSLNLIAAAVSHILCGDSLGVILIPTTILFVVLVSYKQWKTGWR